MSSIDDLKKIVLFENLTEEMLEQLLPIVHLQSFEERQIIYEPGNSADNIYSLKRGKVLLEVELAPTIIISLGSMKPTYTFGWSALLPSRTYTSYAVCAEPCEIFVLPGDKLMGLLDYNTEMGYRVIQNLAAILEIRLERRTAQFLKVISKHPEIGGLLGF